MPKTVTQAGAVPIRAGRVCLVTSSNGQRWVAPKGHIDAGPTPEQTAAVEAWEEAGVRGTLDPEPLGDYRYDKFGATFVVTMYLLRVSEELDAWPECGLRTREWLTPAEAAERVGDAGLGRLIGLAAGRAA